MYAAMIAMSLKMILGVAVARRYADASRGECVFIAVKPKQTAVFVKMDRMVMFGKVVALKSAVSERKSSRILNDGMTSQRPVKLAIHERLLVFVEKIQLFVEKIQLRFTKLTV